MPHGGARPCDQGECGGAEGFFTVTFTGGLAVTDGRQVERHRIVESFDVFSVPAGIQAEIREALNSTAWDWHRDCDGCTCVSEIYWPTRYFPPCLRHDFDCATGHNGLGASRRFYRIQRAYGVNWLQTGARAVGVTVAWYYWLKWR